MLVVRNFSVEVAGKSIVTNLQLSVAAKNIDVLMGPNGSGKSSLSFALSGHPAYLVNPKSEATLNGEDIINLLPQERAQRGLFLSFQHPVAIPGLSVQQLIKITSDHLHPSQKIPTATLRQQLHDTCQLLGIDPEFLTRSINDGFSGGEKKRLEMLQLIMAQPKLAILDEIDSGLDVDAIKVIAKAITFAQQTFGTAFLIVTHYRRILDHIKPDKVHIMVNGSVVKSGNKELIDEIEKNGYQKFSG